MTEPIGTLLSESWKTFTTYKKPIITASVIFGVVLFGLQAVIAENTVGTMEEQFGNIQEIEALAERIEAGDQEAFQEMMMKMGMVGEGGEINEDALEDAAVNLMGKTLPMFGLFFICMMLLTLISSTFYFLLAIEGSQDFMTTLRKVPSLLLPMLGVWIWSFLRSFAWIPVVGIIPAIIIGPRLIMSSVILVQEKKGVLESVSLSHARSKGYWGKIVGNSIVSALVVMIAMIVISLGVGFIADSSEMVAAIAGAIFQSATTAYATIFIVKMSTTISANPFAVVVKK